jgi:transcription-repair coupling factor (superfamily II helicase)
VRAEVAEIAQELVVLYQKRLQEGGHAYPTDTPWQGEFEDAFPYQETPDQLKAIVDVKSDMEDPAAMDRLVCGDVGFGKTEVAIRAAFKAVQAGKQVAVLVPTTLLAQQHFQTFSDRFAAYPVRVEVLSRFLTPGQARKVATDIEAGVVDIVIGTHRLLSGDVTFKDLGLLVVDEEQRFGVSHKEKIKQFRTGVDVLTLTATPIPRTLEMSLTGIRDLTLLNTPPAERQPILTYVGEQDDRAAAEAIRRELLREGQVFYVHNRVQDIDRVAAHLRELVPEARVAIAHGQMDEGSLERVVLDFWEGEYDVLVCTTIIESGIDMPTVNTLVVDRADLLGLGQLHQIRGRVGRSGQRAYAYLFHPRDRTLTEEAYERLKTIGEATELGSGFKIAMRDLEIRGAGNLLGTGQSGHVAAVGYDLYCQMVSEVVAELKGEELREPAEIKLDLPLDANLPKDYVAKEELRLEAYRRLAAVTTEGEVDDIRAEWEDRYGPVPDEAAALLEVARLRAECARLGIHELNVVKVTGIGAAVWTARMSPVKLKVSEEVRLKRLVPKGLYKAEMGQLVVPTSGGRQVAADLVDLLSTLFPVKVAALPVAYRDSPTGSGRSSDQNREESRWVGVVGASSGARFVRGRASPYDRSRAEASPSPRPARRPRDRGARRVGLRFERRGGAGRRRLRQPERLPGSARRRLRERGAAHRAVRSAGDARPAARRGRPAGELPPAVRRGHGHRAGAVHGHRRPGRGRGPRDHRRRPRRVRRRSRGAGRPGRARLLRRVRRPPGRHARPAPRRSPRDRAAGRRVGRDRARLHRGRGGR